MALIDTLRKRLSHRLESHHADEDYSPRFNRNQRVLRERLDNEPDYDPLEDVPSYEASQLQSRAQSQTNINIVTEMCGLDGGLTADGDQSFSNSTNISRQSSVGGSENDIPTNNSTHTTSLKNIGLKFLNAKQHFALACCRDVSLIPSIFGLFKSWKKVFYDSNLMHSNSITSARLPEHFLTGVWCLVAGYLSYSVLDGLMIRWIVTYSTSAAIIRMLTMSTIILAIEQYLLAAFSASGYQYGLHIWILISCGLTMVYIVQNFFTLNVDIKGNRRARFFDFYNIVVFAVVPVGLASFITMIGLLRSLLIVRLDIEKEFIHA